MIVIKIIGITLAAIAVLIAFILSIRIRFRFCFNTESEEHIKFVIKILFFGIEPLKTGDSRPKKEKKTSKLTQRIKKLFGLDITDPDTLKHNTEEKGISGTVNRLVGLASMIASQAFWLLKRFKIHKLKMIAVCSGGDAADAAMEYGIVCSAVYPLLGYIDANIKTARNAKDIRIFCDFDGNSSLDTELKVSVRIIHIVRALIRSAAIQTEISRTEEIKQ